MNEQLMQIGTILPTNKQDMAEAEQRFKQYIDTLVFNTSFRRAMQFRVEYGIITKEDAEAQLKEHNEWWEKRQSARHPHPTAE